MFNETFILDTPALSEKTIFIDLQCINSDELKDTADKHPDMREPGFSEILTIDDLLDQLNELQQAPLSPHESK